MGREGQPPGSRPRDPALLAAAAAVVTASAALLVAAVALAGIALPPGPAAAVAVLPAAIALAVAGAVLRSRLAARRRAHEREAFFAASLARMQGNEGFARALGTLLGDGRAFFRAGAAAVPVRRRTDGRAWLWAVPAGAAAGTPAQSVDLTPGAAEDWLFETEADAWDAERASPEWRVLVLDGTGRPAPGKVPREAVGRLARRLGARRLTVAGFGRGADWEGRLVLADARPAGPAEESLRFAQRLVRELGGVAKARFLLGRLRARIGARERARVARELHDGTIQSLVGVEMEVDVLRRRATQEGLPLAGDLARVQGLVRSEILELRDTMQRLQPIEIGPDELVGFLDATVARFGRDTGIHAVFDCAVEDVDLPARVCREIGRIVQEALQNVRKHSGARNALVRFSRAPSGWRLLVDDDGRGFPFEGTLDHAGLDGERKGPYVIKERVRALGGELTVASSRGGGARLEILLPREAR
jgi:signal transduction histidine kinase